MIPDSTSAFYLSDKSGIFNLYKLDLNKNTSKQITAFGTGIQHYDIVPKFNYFTYVMELNGDEELYLETEFNSNEGKFLPSTLRKQVELSRNINVPAKESVSRSKPIRIFSKSF